MLCFLIILFKLNLLGWHWFIKPYRFQVCNSTKCHLLTASCARCPRQSLFASLFMPLLCLPPHTPTPFPSGDLHTVVCVYVSYIYFHFLPLIPSPSFTQTTKPPALWQLSVPRSQASVSTLFISLFCSLDSTHVVDPCELQKPGNNMTYFTFKCFWSASIKVMP